MDINTIKESLKKLADELPDCPEKVVVLVMTANLCCGVSNQPMADKARSIAHQILAEISA
jgi:hypothetical protein